MASGTPSTQLGNHVNNHTLLETDDKEVMEINDLWISINWSPLLKLWSPKAKASWRPMRACLRLKNVLTRLALSRLRKPVGLIENFYLLRPTSPRLSVE